MRFSSQFVGASLPNKIVKGIKARLFELGVLALIRDGDLASVCEEAQQCLCHKTFV
jgi:hypothetical protein